MRSDVIKSKPKQPSPDDRSAIHRAICARIKQTRESTGQTQAEVIQAIGAPESAYPKWENRSPPPLYWLLKLCRYLKMDPWWVLTGQFDRSELSPDFKRPFGGKLRRSA